jgi:NAD(P)-dependent dehydrogenase (short-subunit alcohol dehydrogenase family)
MNGTPDRVVLVMGASSLLGRAVALAFARQGATVVANDIAPGRLESTLQAVRAAGGQVEAYHYDAAKKMPVQALVGDVVDAYGRLDVLVNAGWVTPAADLLALDEWDWHRTLDMNLAGPFFALQVAGRVMREAGGGAIANLLLDPDALSRQPGRAVLAASQAALAALTRSAALELGPYNIRVNAVALRLAEPDEDDSPAADSDPGTGSRAGLGRLTHIPVPFSADPETVVAKVLALCDLDSDVTGQMISL